MEGKNERLFRSSFFRRLFFSYVLLILVSIAIFCFWYLYSYRTTSESAVRNEAQQQATAFATRTDQNMLIAQKKDGIVKAYQVDETKDKMVAGEAALALMWSGDAMYAIDLNDELDYFVPAEGSNVWVDGMCVPKVCQNKEAAECFIDFMCRPDIAQKNMEYIYYSSPIKQVVENLSEEELASTAMNPTDEMVARCEYYVDISDVAYLYDDIWMDVLM